MLNINNIVDKQAARWRDINPSDRRLELLGKISLIALALITLAGVVVGCYYLATTTTTANIGKYVVNSAGYHDYVVTGTYQFSNAPFMVLPILFGTAAIIASVVSHSFVNRERHHKGHSPTYDATGRISRYTELQQKNFKNAYDDISRNGGLGPLVRHGVFSTLQGNALRALFTDLVESNRVLDYFNATNAPHLPAANYAAVSAYRAAKELHEGLEARWQKILLGVPEAVEPTQLPSTAVSRSSGPQGRWRNITPNKRKGELLLKIALIALALLILAGSAVGSYYIYNASHCGLMALPLVFGPPLANLPFMSSFLIDMEPGRGTVPYDALWRADRRYLLRHKSFQEVYTYLKSHEGIEPLVRYGVLSINQGERLATLFSDYDANSKIMNAYGKTSIPAPERLKIPDYREATNRASDVLASFEILQKEVIDVSE